ncbi:BTB/POZ domain-containing protein At5g17580 [Ricinus communis]|uniref:Protein binding protein, putative n=1 Tax=Ricinus communis TaxID=3988 RepID=B9SDE1_RICCO|nr:BTB/POZ domain-containing protein At5g17580 [Ricinus communis]EEF38378.1 protein binding protein, putative [Ricinus communis]|eukprot:XP_002524010.1 BTB/POZ domain-containing protein At5g17580 [Ricinus communis]
MDEYDVSPWLSKPTFPKEKHLQAHEFPFSLDRKNLAARSAKVSALLKENPQVELSSLLQDIPADTKTLELVLRFCHGFELTFSSENVIQLICLSNYLEMTDTFSKSNLLNKAVTFFEQRVLPSWDETIRALRSAGSSLQEAVNLGLFDVCLESLVKKAQVNPHLLGDPFKNSTNVENCGDEEEDYRPKVRRRLFGLDWESEDLTTLSLQLYHRIAFTMNKHQIPPKYVAASLCKYAEKWVFYSDEGVENVSIYKRNSKRDVIEAVESLLPHEKGLIPCTILFKMLKFAIPLESSSECQNGLENRIGKQLEQATVEDLLILSQGYAKETQYDIECVRRLLKQFYGNYSSSDSSGLNAVAQLIEEFIIEVASDIDLKINTFAELGEMSMAVSLGTEKNCDGIYRAVDIYLDKHRYLTELEREEVCRMLDCYKLSPEGCEHAANNERLPLRFKVQILFVWQSQMRNSIANQVNVFCEKLRTEGVDEDEEKEVKAVDFDEEEVRSEMEKMSIKVMELEKECCEMRKEIENGCSNHHKMKKGKISMWKEMKRKLGCMSSIHDCNCQVKKKKKVHPKH